MNTVQAMWLVVKGKGNGGAITGEGDTETTQHWIVIPRETDVVVVLLTCPSRDDDAYKKPFEKAIAAMAVGGERTGEQKDSR